MIKQKNDTRTTRGWKKRLLITAVLLVVAALGLGGGFLAILSNKVYMYQDWIFPYKAGVHKSICVPWGDDGSYALAEALSIQYLTPTLYRIDLYVDGIKIADDQIEQRRIGATGSLTTWCYAKGLDDGVYQMEAKINDLQDQVIGAYQWTITIK